MKHRSDGTREEASPGNREANLLRIVALVLWRKAFQSYGPPALHRRFRSPGRRRILAARSIGEGKTTRSAPDDDARAFSAPLLRRRHQLRHPERIRPGSVLLRAWSFTSR